MTIAISDVLKVSETVIQGVIDHEGLINSIAGFAGVLPEVALAEKALPVLVSVLQLLGQESGKDPLEAFKDLISHLTPGQPNSPVLSGQTTP